MKLKRPRLPEGPWEPEEPSRRHLRWVILSKNSTRLAEVLQHLLEKEAAYAIAALPEVMNILEHLHQQALACQNTAFEMVVLKNVEDAMLKLGYTEVKEGEA